MRVLPLAAVLLSVSVCSSAQQPGVTAVPDHVGRAIRGVFARDDARIERATAALARQDVERYEIDACVDPTRRTVSGECAITLRATADRLVFLLNPRLAVSSVSGAAGEPLAYSRSGDTLRVRLRGVPPVPTRVILRYQGAVAAGGGVAAGPGLLYLGPGSLWHPSSEAWDPATMRIVIRYPDGCSSVVSGTLVGMAPLSSGGRCSSGDVWEVGVPIARAAAVVGRVGSSFSVWEYVFLGYHWYVPARGDTLTAGWKPDTPPGPTAEIKGLVSYLSACYGPYPFRWLNVVLLPPNLAGFEASSSGPGLVVVQDLDGLGLAGGSAALAKSSLELSGGWWSGSMDAWPLVAEGLSAAAEVDWLEDTGGEEEALRRREFRRSQYVRALADSGGSVPLSLCLGDAPCQDRRVCRGKGSALFDMLERLVGRDGYCRALSVFADRYRGRTTGLHGLAAVFEETAGQDLEWFFYEWVYRGDLPTYAVDYEASRLRGGQYRVRGTIRQDGEMYRMPVPLTIDVGTWSYDETVAIESSEQPFDLVTDVEPIMISVDGDGVIPMIDSAERAKQHFDRGNAARAANDWKEAVDEYAAAAFLERGRVAYQKAYGEALVRAGRLTAGIETLEKAARLDPRDAGLKLLLAQLLVRAGSNATALKYLDAYAAIEKGDPIGQTTRALALIGLRRFDEAETAIASARVLVAQAGSPSSAVEALYVASGRYHEAVENAAAAVRDYERALQANPKSEEARRRLSALGSGPR